MNSMTQESQRPQVIITQSTKSVGVAIALGLFFGPIGMFYSTILGAIIMMIIAIVVGIITLGFGLLIIFPICAIWAGIAAKMYNNKLMASI